MMFFAIKSIHTWGNLEFGIIFKLTRLIRHSCLKKKIIPAFTNYATSVWCTCRFHKEFPCTQQWNHVNWFSVQQIRVHWIPSLLDLTDSPTWNNSFGLRVLWTNTHMEDWEHVVCLPQISMWHRKKISTKNMQGEPLLNWYKPDVQTSNPLNILRCAATLRSVWRACDKDIPSSGRVCPESDASDRWDDKAWLVSFYFSGKDHVWSGRRWIGDGFSCSHNTL